MEGAEKAENQRDNTTINNNNNTNINNNNNNTSNNTNNNNITNNNNNNNIINVAQEISRVDGELAVVREKITKAEITAAQYELKWENATGEDKKELSIWLAHYHGEVKNLGMKEEGLVKERRDIIASQIIGQQG